MERTILVLFLVPLLLSRPDGATADETPSIAWAGPRFSYWGPSSPGLQRDSTIRLVNGPRSSEGRVEVLINIVGQNVWTTVCGAHLDVNDAKVICRSMGYTTNAPLVKTGAYYGRGTSAIVLNYLFRCRGTEQSLKYCPVSAVSTLCDHSQDVGVNCRPTVPVRVVNGSSPSNGRLEVFRAGQWGTVCDDGFTVNDAKVACRTLGYTGVQPLVRGSAYYGQGSGNILMDDVGCSGYESNLGYCSYITSHNCWHGEDVGINCRPGVTGVRLANGNRASRGRLEVMMDGRWGTVCDDSFGVSDARVACRMLGYSRKNPLVRSSAYYGQGTGDIVMDDVYCTGTETSLGSCSFTDSRSENCGHNEDVGIDCQPPIHVSSVRLVNGRDSSEGRLQVLISGQWGTVCDDAFGVSDAKVVCRMLGYPQPHPVVWSRAHYGQGSGIILMDDVNCLGSETNLGQCSHTDNHNCNHVEDVGVDCTPHVSRIQLVDGPKANAGRLEVYKNGQWGTVCDDSFSSNDAKVVCRMLGYPSAVPIVRGSAHYGEGTGSIFMDDVNCIGSESHLSQCSFTASHNCGHHEDVGIDCNTALAVTQVRLVNGSMPSQGRLEVVRNGQWGTVCDDSFDVNDAKVVCHMLGFVGLNPSVKGYAFYGQGSGSILMDDVSCMGTETTLASCQFTSQHNCVHQEDVGIDCRPLVNSVRLIGGSRSSEGRLEVQMGGRWGTVCDDYFDIKDAKVACKMLGYYSSHPVVKHFGPGTGSILMDDLRCNGKESNLGYCPFHGIVGENCGHHEDVGLQCQPTVSGVRLVNGGKPSQGRLEVNINGRWGTVCDDYFTGTDATVVCGMLGYSRRSATVRGSASFGQGTGETLMDDVGCSGSETHLSQCSFVDSRNEDCSHSEDVGVVCTATVSSVRLVNGTSSSQGRLEVSMDGEWGTVCDDAFSVNDARVACRMLGYSGGTPVVKSRAYFGQGVGAIQMDNLGCTGNESNLGQCSHVSDVQHNCGHHEDVGIIC